MAITVCTPSEGDAPEVSTVHLRAMNENLLTHAQFPSPEGLRFFHGWIAETTIEHLRDEDKGVLVARDEETGEIASFVKWLVRRRTDEDEPAEEWPETARAEYLDDYAALTERVRAKVMGEASYYHATYLCTDPRWGGRGAASKLLRKVQELAAADKMSVVLEATMNAVPFYQKLGFEIMDELSIMIPPRGSSEPTELYEERCMVWTPPPKPAS